jgi:hypothetical protein
MRCMAPFEPIAACGSRRPQHEPGGVAQRTRDRRTAASYLQAAARTADAEERRSLRRRAAELILPRGGATMIPDREA